MAVGYGGMGEGYLGRLVSRRTFAILFFHSSIFSFLREGFRFEVIMRSCMFR